MRRKISGNNGGFTLIEVVVAITVLALIAAPVGGALAVSGRVNAYADRVLQARLNVSSAAETLMAEGIDESKINQIKNEYKVDITTTTENNALYEVTITSSDIDSVKIETKIRAAGVGDGRGT